MDPCKHSTSILISRMYSSRLHCDRQQTLQVYNTTGADSYARCHNAVQMQCIASGGPSVMSATGWPVRPLPQSQIHADSTHTPGLQGVCKMHQTDRQRNALLQCDGSTHRRCCTDAATCHTDIPPLHIFAPCLPDQTHPHSPHLGMHAVTRPHGLSTADSHMHAPQLTQNPHISTPASTWAGSGHAHVMHTPQPLKCVVHLLLQAVSTNNNVMCPCTITGSMMLPTAVGEGTPCI